MALGIDLGRSTIKLVELRRGVAKVRIAGLARKRVGSLRASEYPHLAPKILQSAVSDKTDDSRSVVGISGRNVNLQMRMFPVSKMMNYPRMIRNEIEQHRSEGPDLYVDHATLRSPDKYFPRYLAVIGLSEGTYVEEQLGIVRSAGLRASDVVPTPFALAATYAHNYGAEGGVVMLLDLGADSTDMVLVRGGRMIFARNISQGARVFDEQIKATGIESDEEAEFYKIRFGSLGPNGQQDQRAEQIRPMIRQGAWQLVGVIRSSLTFAKNTLEEQDLKVDRVYISGGGARVPGLNDYLKSALQAPVESLDPFRKIDASLIRQAGEEEALQLPTDLAVPIGLALIGLGEKTPHISLVPEKVRKAREMRRTLPYSVGAALALIAAIAWVSITLSASRSTLVADSKKVTAEIERVKEDIRGLDQVQKDYRKLYARQDVLRNTTVTGRGILGCYRKLRLLYREGMIIEKFEFHEPEEQRRGIFNIRDRGHLAGVIQEENDNEYKLRGIGPAVRGDILKTFEEGWDQQAQWNATVPRMYILGEVDEYVRGGPHELLKEIERQLTDPTAGTVAGLEWAGQSERRPGWRAFRIWVKFE